MSEAELHILKQRMLQGARQKAQRGELVIGVPIGYVRDRSGQVTLDPDEQVQAVVQWIFRQFERIGTISSVLRLMVKQQILLPVRANSGPDRGRIQWRRPNQTTLRGEDQVSYGEPRCQGLAARALDEEVVRQALLSSNAFCS